jgi:uncharacterized protein involved in type VI secretion and phage assembly
MAESFSVKINFVDINTFTGDLVEFVVDTNVFLPGMFEILLKDEVVDPLSGALKYTDNQAIFKVGAPIDISITSTDIPNEVMPVSNTLISGEITAIEPVFADDGGVQLRIRGFDLGHRLTIGKKIRTFGDANPQIASLTELQIVTKIATESGLLAEVDMSGLSSLRYHYIMQYDQSDWEFLWSRAQMLGYQVYVDGRVLKFKKAGETRNSLLPTDVPAPLSWGSNLGRFEPRIVSMGQVNSASVYGFDPDTKKTVSSKSKSHNSNTAAKIADPLYGARSLLAGYMISDAENVMMSPEARDNSIAKVMAEAKFAEHDSQFVRASGTLSIGDPRLLAGTKVAIKNVGVRFGGQYYITEARHVYRRGTYTVHFEVSGRNPYTVRHLLLGSNQPSNKINGVVLGLVTNIGDPQSLGRVMVKYPWMPKDRGAELASNWARLASPGAGNGRGIFFTPEVDDEVLVAFEQGDVNYPYVVGALWNANDKPPEGAGKILDDGKKKTNQRIVRSRSGHVIILDDTQGEEKIIIEDKTKKNSIVIDSKNKSMVIKAEGDLTLEAGGKFIMKSKQDFNLESQAKIAVSAKSSMNLEGSTGTTIKTGQSQLALQASGADLKGTKVSVQGQAQTAIQGAQTSIKGSAMVEIQGTLVKIN